MWSRGLILIRSGEDPMTRSRFLKDGNEYPHYTKGGKILVKVSAYQRVYKSSPPILNICLEQIKNNLRFNI